MTNERHLGETEPEPQQTVNELRAKRIRSLGKARILGEITMVVAGIATAATGGYVIHQKAENKDKVVAGSMIMLTGGTVTMLAGGLMERKSK